MQLNYDQIAQHMRTLVEQTLLAEQAAAISKPMAEVQAATQMVAEVVTGIDLDDPESCAAAVPTLHDLLQTAHAELQKAEQLKHGYTAALNSPLTHQNIIAHYKTASGADWVDRHVSPGRCAVIPELENREFSGMTMAEVVRTHLPAIESARRRYSQAEVFAFFVAKGLKGKKSSFYQAVSVARK
ncbi:hypothetical protein [Burkholderia cepacia]|jgi:hypothetical protein|uniref:hypothetical protein n=1 Tax=Burkholderia cepacia TaxID=292 RepID=UPI000F5D6854|nr:hypothetical protein [Burkholderia cepacia]RQT37036.1 hypothetical protein DF135_13520 [Burkholderia cepacia]